MKSLENTEIMEKEIIKKKGGMALVLLLGVLVASIAGMVAGGMLLEAESMVVGAGLLIFCIIILIGSFIAMAGLHVVNPNEALVLTLFGKYYGTLKKPGFYYTNPLTMKSRR